MNKDSQYVHTGSLFFVGKKTIHSIFFIFPNILYSLFIFSCLAINIRN